MVYNIEAGLISFLNKRLDVDVFADVPAKVRPVRFITVERTGGGLDSHVLDRPMVAIQCWAESRVEACNLALAVDELIEEMASLPNVCKARRNSLYNFPDLTGEKSHARYQVVVDLTTINNF